VIPETFLPKFVHLKFYNWQVFWLILRLLPSRSFCNGQWRE